MIVPFFLSAAAIPLAQLAEGAFLATSVYLAVKSSNAH